MYLTCSMRCSWVGKGQHRGIGIEEEFGVSGIACIHVGEQAALGSMASL
jgi:hypothetical protein